MRKFIAITTAVLLSVVSANAQYKMKVTLKNGQETEYKVSEIKSVTWEDINQYTHEYVDLGLPSGTLWATCNVGASSPEDYGDYYAWGETETKDCYDWSTYKWCKDSYDTMTKYCTDSYYGTVDNKTVLDPEDDVAHVQWGGSWRMPTLAQCQELIECCSSSWTSVNGVCGRKFVSSNGNSIFLPAAGSRWKDRLDDAGSWGVYWSGTLNDYHDYIANVLNFSSRSLFCYYYDRNEGFSVRPVWSKSVTDFVKVTGISFDKSSLSLTVGNTYTLMPTVSPSNATDKSLTWSSSDPSVASVSSSGKVSATKAGTATITATANDGSGVKATCSVTVTSNQGDVYNGHEYVDLGLPSGTKWATCNVGANSPEEYGGYYAWGEVAEKSVYDWDTYAYGSDWDDYQYIGSEISGTQYDVAHVQWGGSWRMPTLAQCKELIECCSSSWTSVNGVWGRKFVGPNGNSIFLPAAGCRWDDDPGNAGSYGDYWSGTLYDHYNGRAYYLRFRSGYLGWDGYYRDYGRSVRPVCQ